MSFPCLASAAALPDGNSRRRRRDERLGVTGERGTGARQFCAFVVQVDPRTEPSREPSAPGKRI